MHTYSILTDIQLINLLKSDDESAFTEIYNRYWKVLFQTSYSIIQDEESAKDVVQNVFISLWQRREVSNIQSLKPYLQQSARFLVLKAIRSNKTDSRFYDRVKEITSEILNDDPLIFKEQQNLIQSLLNTLPENCKETFRLSREEGYTYKQIASQFSISEKAVEKRMSKSLKHIRDGLNWELCVALIMSSSL
ncbi:RNA polymerase sigma-70 factor, ECF subfamily [Daejeonella rubra]|uniref:RNA polymerase sigma-70 factor, ECF subfamily n=1 Tax=Daejeonella rubra TaxID=990371 RepID=A0A1G9TTK8_9SPHI|nr:RNA polymerase sigma-70 factor [Daejeonella rubra]SDM50555.1 RNA polymerase sigma-70 factor, ECF subfamily [Daejeonella rubra]